jgi:hypothetical protein
MPVPRAPVAGAIELNTGPSTVKVSVLLVPPGVVTLTVLAESVAVPEIVNVVVIVVEFTTVMAPTVTPVPDTAAVVPVAVKLVPVRVTGTAAPRRPVLGATEFSVGTGVNTVTVGVSVTWMVSMSGKLGVSVTVIVSVIDTLAGGTPLETTRLTADPGLTSVAATGLSLITLPNATVLLKAAVTVPTTRPALVIAVVAPACDKFTTFGTAIGPAMIRRAIGDGDLAACLSVDPARTGEELVGHDRAIDVWSNLMQSCSFNAAVIEADPPIAGHRIVAFGASVFVSRAFAEQEISNPRPGLNARIIASVDSSQPAVLNKAQFRSANTKDGLDVVILYPTWRKGLLIGSRFRRLECC